MTLYCPYYKHTKFGAHRSRIGRDTPFRVFFQDGGRRHDGYVIRRFWTTHDVPVAGFYVICQWRNDQLEFIRDIMILPFRDFGWKMHISPILGGFGRF